MSKLMNTLILCLCKTCPCNGYPFSTKPTDTERNLAKPNETKQNQTKPSGQNVTTPTLFSGHGLEGQVQVLVNITALGYVRICMRNKQTVYFLFLYNYLWTRLRINGIKLNICSCITSRSHHAIACVDYSYLLNGDIHDSIAHCCRFVDLVILWISVDFLRRSRGFFTPAKRQRCNSKATKICHLREIMV